MRKRRGAKGARTRSPRRSPQRSPQRSPGFGKSWSRPRGPRRHRRCPDESERRRSSTPPSRTLLLSRWRWRHWTLSLLSVSKRRTTASALPRRAERRAPIRRRAAPLLRCAGVGTFCGAFGQAASAPRSCLGNGLSVDYASMPRRLSSAVRCPHR